MPRPVVLPDHGPTLTELVRARFGLRARTTIAVFLAAIALVAFAIVVVRPRVDGLSPLLYDGRPVFNLVYAHDSLDVASPQGGELVRLEGRRGRQAVTVGFRPLPLPAARGDAVHGLLPVYASGHVDELRRSLDAFQLREEGRARVNNALGYEVRFRSGPPGRRTFGSDIIVIPGERDTRNAMLLSLRRDITGSETLSEEEDELADVARRAMHSFRYGEGRG